MLRLSNVLVPARLKSSPTTYMHLEVARDPFRSVSPPSEYGRLREVFALASAAMSSFRGVFANAFVDDASRRVRVRQSIVLALAFRLLGTSYG